MLKRIVLLSAFLSTKAQAFDFHLKDGGLFNIDESYVEWRKYEAYRNSLTPGKDDWQWTAESHNTVSIYKRFYWDTNFHLSMDSSQVRYGGLEYYMGLKIMPYLSAIKYHHSVHCFDVDCGRFPVEDSYGFRLYFKH